jgi:hypothetical protein
MTASSEFVCERVHQAGNAAVGPRVAEVRRDVEDAETLRQVVRGVDRRTVLYGAIAMAMALLVYVNALHNPFVYDDFHTVITNTSIGSLSNLRAIVLHDITRPLVNFSYAVDRATWGPAPFGFHVTNVLLHAVNVGLFIVFMRKAGLRRGAAFAASALFAVHPMMTEAVGYVSGRSEVLSTTFLLTAMLCADTWMRNARMAPLLGMIAAWVAALLSKETAAMFPFVVFAYDVLARPNEDGRRRRIAAVYVPLILATVVIGIARLLVLVRIEYPGQAVWQWRYLLIDADVFRQYVGMLLIPDGQALFHEVVALDSVWRMRALVDIAIVGAFVAVAWRLRRVHGFASFGLVWFVLLLVPSAVLIAFNQGEPMTEHRVYAASIGVLLTTAVAMHTIAERVDVNRSVLRIGALVAVSAIVASFAMETVQRNAVWRSPIALWRESVELAPRHPRPRLLLAESLQDAGRWDEAIEQCRIAVQLRPSDPAAHVAFGRSLAYRERWDEARKEFHTALDLDPQSVAARRTLEVLDNLERRFVRR